MKRQLPFFRRSVLILLGITTIGLTTARAETFVGSDVDTRVSVAFKVNDSAAQAWLPKGWTVAPLAKGPLAGSNLLLVFIDRQLGLDSEGKPAKDAIYRGIAVVVPASRNEESRIFVARLYLSDSTVNPYKNTIGVTVTRKRSVLANGGDAASGTDEWSVDDGAGGALTFRMNYQGAIPKWSERESVPYSNVEPESYRIYRYKQITDLLRSVPAGVDRLDDFAFTSSIAELAPMFDGNEELIAVVNIPWYLRHIYTP